jgi:hypothetical protein
VREIREEVGHAESVLGPCVWTRQHEFTFLGTRIRQSECFFVARCEPFEVDDSGLDELESEVVRGHRWWTLEEMQAAPVGTFAPRSLPDLVEPLLKGEVPATTLQLPEES